MSTLAINVTKANALVHTARGVRFADRMLYVELTDGREIGVPLSQLPWLNRATLAQRHKWHIEPLGFAVYWDDLDDGVEVEHLLG
ncbi:MAG: DUF2442 domain-containing protein [Verrucomicrobia bacterium]|nr:DUF2442 domain-containing protein [Verrucomicrobiota bacterium]